MLWSETTTSNLLWLWSATCITLSAFHTELYDAKRTGHAYQCSRGVNRRVVTAPWSGKHQRTEGDGASYNTISRSRLTNWTWPGPDTIDRMEIHWLHFSTEDQLVSTGCNSFLESQENQLIVCLLHYWKWSACSYEQLLLATLSIIFSIFVAAIIFVLHCNWRMRTHATMQAWKKAWQLSYDRALSHV